VEGQPTDLLQRVGPALARGALVVRLRLAQRIQRGRHHGRLLGGEPPIDPIAGPVAAGPDGQVPVAAHPLLGPLQRGDAGGVLEVGGHCCGDDGAHPGQHPGIPGLRFHHQPVRGL
jgi:hypothetical protein